MVNSFYIPQHFPDTHQTKLNDEGKNTYSVVWYSDVEELKVIRLSPYELDYARIKSEVEVEESYALKTSLEDESVEDSVVHPDS
nr:hypothetical protein [Tanacetum cinerariifolium]